MKSETLRSEFVSQFNELFHPLTMLGHTVEEGELVIQAKLDKRTLSFWCREVNRGTPLLLQQMADRMNSRRAPLILRDKVERGLYIPTLVAPHLTDGAITKCRDLKHAGFDLSGNVVINADAIHILQSGKSKKVDDEPRRRIFGGKSSRVARILLADTKKRWLSRPLADEAKISQGLAVQALHPMAEQEWVRVVRGNRGGIEMVNPKAILDAWRDDYEPPIIDTERLFAVDGHEATAKRICAYCDKNNIQYALTSFMGASFSSAVGNYSEASILIMAPSPQIKAIGRDLKLTPATRGNIALLRTDDPAVFYGAQRVKKLNVAHPIQIYLDLSQDPRRGREQAEMFRESVIGF